MSLYVYCIGTQLPMRSPVLTGIQNHSVRTIEAESLHITVSDFVGSDLRPSKENIFDHERVVESCMEPQTPLPFRFGTVISEDKLRDFIRQNIGILRSNLEQVRDCVEMNLKVMMRSVDSGNSGDAKTGTDFLQAKRRVYELQRETSQWVDAAVAGLIRQTDAGLIQGNQTVIVRLAHLVPRDCLPAYKSHLDTLVLSRADYAFLRSGPWPPYSFISTPRVA